MKWSDFSPRRLLSWLLNDWQRKLVALFYALAIYYAMVYSNVAEERLTDVPVTLDVPAGLIDMTRETPKVTVTVSGTPRAINALVPADIRANARVQLARFIPGEVYILKLFPSDFRTPLGVSVTRVENEIQLNLERRLTRRVPVEPGFGGDGRLSGDYAVGKVTFSPEQVQLSGPESVLEKIRLVQSSPIPLDASVTSSFSYKAGLALPEGVSASPSSVTAEVRVVRRLIDRTFRSVPLLLLTNPQSENDFQVELLSASHAEVTLNGPKGKLEALSPAMVRAVLDISNLGEPGTYTVQLACPAPDPQLTVKSFYPEKIQLKLTRGR